MNGTLFVIAAPSGAGKTSLVKALVGSMEAITVSVSHTTRAQRQGEQDGVDYHFVSAQTFETMAKDNAFLEHATVFDHAYGTSRSWVMETLAKGVDVVLEIDWQGARQIRQSLPECVTIFILPPSRAVLEERLRKRGQDDAAVIERRMRDAISEIEHYAEFDYLVVNEQFDVALKELCSIVAVRRLATPIRLQHCRPIIEKLLK